MSGMIQASAPRTFPKGLPQVAALLIVFLVNWLVFRDFFALRLQDGRLFGSLVDVLNRGAPVAILALGMTLVIATRGIDLSVGAVMAIAGATAATLTAVCSGPSEGCSPHRLNGEGRPSWKPIVVS